MVTSAIPSLQYVTGSGINDQFDARMALLNALALNTADTTGWYDAGIQGGSGLLPTLNREQLNLSRDLGVGNLALGRDSLNAQIADAQRQYQLDLQRFGLDVANFNFQQRLGEATTRLQQLDILSGLRGPGDYLKYNYMLNNMAAPQGQEVNPYNFTNGLNQPYTAPTMPQIQQPAPTTQYNQQSSGTTQPPAQTPKPATGAGGTTPAIPATPTYTPPSSGTAISGNPGSDKQFFDSTGWGSQPQNIQDDFWRISNLMNQQYQTQSQNAGGNPGYAGGGVAPGMAIVGDQESGKPTHHEEMVVSPAPFVVIPHDQLMNMQRMFDGGIVTPHAAQGGMYGGYEGQPPMQRPMSQPEQPTASTQPYQNPYAGEGSYSPGGWSRMHQGNQGEGGASIQPVPNQSYGGWDGGDWQRSVWPHPQFPAAWGTPYWGYGIPHAATGGAFQGGDPGNGMMSYTTYQPQDTVNAPFVQQTLGHMQSPAFQQRGQDLGPFGKQPFSYTNFLGLLPSAQQMLKGYIETPTGMGGLGADFLDELERSRRAAALGQSFGPSTYGY